MPRKRPCQNTNCRELTDRGGFCEGCKANKAKRRNVPRHRVEKKRIYNSKDWRHVRQRALERDKFQCVNCKPFVKRAQDVDHIIDIEDDPEKAFELDNLQSLCKSCHSKKTAATRKR